MRGSLLRLRGFSRHKSRCPRCGGETMRTNGMPALLGSLLRMFGLRLRWCRRCLRQWISR